MAVRSDIDGSGPPGAPFGAGPLGDAVPTMRLASLLLAASLLTFAMPVSAAPALLGDGGGSDGRCAPDPCGTINTLCRKVGGADCVRVPVETLSAEVQCMGPVCEAINAVCWIALKTWCVG